MMCREDAYCAGDGYSNPAKVKVSPNTPDPDRNSPQNDGFHSNSRGTSGPNVAPDGPGRVGGGRGDEASPRGAVLWGLGQSPPELNFRGLLSEGLLACCSILVPEAEA